MLLVQQSGRTCQEVTLCAHVCVCACTHMLQRCCWQMLVIPKQEIPEEKLIPASACCYLWTSAKVTEALFLPAAKDARADTEIITYLFSHSKSSSFDSSQIRHFKFLQLIFFLPSHLRAFACALPFARNILHPPSSNLLLSSYSFPQKKSPWSSDWVRLPLPFSLRQSRDPLLGACWAPLSLQHRNKRFWVLQKKFQALSPTTSK